MHRQCQLHYGAKGWHLKWHATKSASGPFGVEGCHKWSQRSLRKSQEWCLRNTFVLCFHCIFINAKDLLNFQFFKTIVIIKYVYLYYNHVKVWYFTLKYVLNTDLYKQSYHIFTLKNTWSFPNCICSQNQKRAYIDPITGYNVFTEFAHRKRERCCRECL